MQKRWKVAEKAPSVFMAEFSQFQPIVSQLLYTRGIQKQEEAKLFLSPDYAKMHNPFLFRDMAKAVERIWRAIEKREKILIHGDYDADGVTSAAIIYKALKFFQADVDVFIPHRELDGYGLRIENVKRFKEQAVDLLITVDCGITNVEEIRFLMGNNVDVIITDHHEPLEFVPEAFAILDAKMESSGYPFRDLSGAGVAFKLVQGLFSDETKTRVYFQQATEFLNAESFLKWILDIVAVGTVADVVPLVNENRILAKWGLVVLEKTRNVGLKKLLEVVGNKKVDSFTIGYQIAPRLNAAGRMNHAVTAFKLLVTENAEEAEKLAWELQQNNGDRQKATEIAVTQAKQQLLENPENQKFLLAYHPEWEAGVVGLIAGKLCEEFYRPVIIMTESGGRIVGSGRSVDGFNITQSLVSVKSLLARYGGHSQACGFTLSGMNVLEDFRLAIVRETEKELETVDFSPFLEIDSELVADDISFELLECLKSFEPHGEGNDKPLFQLSNLSIVAMDALGGNAQHLRLRVKQLSPKIYKMMWFGKANEWLSQLNVGDIIDAVVEMGINEWNGRREIEFRLVDLRVQDYKINTR
jgi:single-stranded-DNA-specific exonuclease